MDGWVLDSGVYDLVLIISFGFKTVSSEHTSQAHRYKRSL